MWFRVGSSERSSTSRSAVTANEANAWTLPGPLVLLILLRPADRPEAAGRCQTVWTDEWVRLRESIVRLKSCTTGGCFISFPGVPPLSAPPQPPSTFYFLRLMNGDNNRIRPGNRNAVIQARKKSQWAVKSSVNGSYLCCQDYTQNRFFFSLSSRLPGEEERGSAKQSRPTFWCILPPTPLLCWFSIKTRAAGQEVKGTPPLPPLDDGLATKARVKDEQITSLSRR